MNISWRGLAEKTWIRVRNDRTEEATRERELKTLHKRVNEQVQKGNREYMKKEMDEKIRYQNK